MKIYLIGMMGSGKSTLGTMLAKELGYKFIDMDSYIENETNMTINDIFKFYGEAWFREYEKKVLKDFFKMDNLVIATGGGIIKNKDNKALIDGLCVYLECPLEELEKRLANDNQRPLLKTRSVKDILEERIPLYEYFKDIKVLNIDMNKAIKEIMEAIK
ncbi:MAG: shikimate kinase [Acholeplasmatales bacterium]|nr:shikimate kinase [Acholeplasmatales bacterium]